MTQREFVDRHIEIESEFRHPSRLWMNEDSGGESFYSYAIKAPECRIVDGKTGPISFVPLAEIKGTVKIENRTIIFTTPIIKITTPGWHVSHRIHDGKLKLRVKEV